MAPSVTAPRQADFASRLLRLGVRRDEVSGQEVGGWCTICAVGRSPRMTNDDHVFRISLALPTSSVPLRSSLEDDGGHQRFDPRVRAVRSEGERAQRADDALMMATPAAGTAIH